MTRIGGPNEGQAAERTHLQAVAQQLKELSCYADKVEQMVAQRVISVCGPDNPARSAAVARPPGTETSFCEMMTDCMRAIADSLVVIEAQVRRL